MLKFFNKKKNIRVVKKNQKGFTLVEALISVAILAISVAAPLSLAADGIRAAQLAERQIIVFYLAQDALETIRNVKASNRLSGVSMLQGLNDCMTSIGTGNGCAVETADKTFNGCGDATCSVEGKMFLNNASGYYSHNLANGDETIFRRKVKVTDDGLPTVVEAHVEVTVYWPDLLGNEKSYVVNANLKNW